MELNNDEFVIGNCETMCPVAEMRLRERHGLLHKFEIVKGTETFKKPRVDRKRAVKEYRRPAAGKQDASPAELRPAKVLLTTTNYLIDTICGMDTANWGQVYEFVFDRLRAIRQDMVMQNIQCSKIITVLECCVRFHIFSSYKLRDAPAGDFNEKINTTHTQECVKRLLCLYEEDTNCKCNQGEFLALYLLFNLGSVEAIQLAIEHKDTIKSDPDFQLALKISLAWLNLNYVRLFKLAVELSPLSLCALQMHFQWIQNKALGVMSSGYNSKTLGYSLSDLTELLCMDSETVCQSSCEAHGLSVKANGLVVFNKAAFQSSNSVSRLQCKVLDNKLDSIHITKLLKGRCCNCF